MCVYVYAWMGADIFAMPKSASALDTKISSNTHFPFSHYALDLNESSEKKSNRGKRNTGIRMCVQSSDYER